MTKLIKCTKNVGWLNMYEYLCMSFYKDKAYNLQRVK